MNDAATMRCEEAREMLPSYVRGEQVLSIRRHLARCTGCRSELARYEALSSSLGSLRGIHSEPPADLLKTLAAIPQSSRVEVVRTHVARNKKAYAGGVAVALAGAAGAALWRSRTRHVATV